MTVGACRSATFGVAGWLICTATSAYAQTADRQLAYGRYVATAGDCAACHTAPGGRPYAGGLAIKSPVGTIYASNITPSKAHGIGRYTRDQFTAALRKGIRADGAHIYPAMPYTSYAKLSDRDIDALYIYFMRGVRPVEVSPPTTKLPFPASVRLSMAAWNLLFLEGGGFKPDPSRTPAWNRGKYLVEAAEHCGECHTPRGYLMQARNSRAFTGGQVGAWYAPDVTSDKVNGIGSWSKPELIAYLRTGANRSKARAAGTMGEAVEHSLRYLSPADLNAIASYIMTVPASHDAAPSGRRFDRGEAGSVLASTRGARTEAGAGRGAVLFQGNCATCHGAFGQGSRDGYYPALFHGSTTGAPNSNLVATILNGVNRITADGQAFMPGFGGKPDDATRLSDRDIASLASYVRGQYGAGDAPVTESEVASVRQGGPDSSLITVARIGIVAALLATAALLVQMFVRRYRRASREA